MLSNLLSIYLSIYYILKSPLNFLETFPSRHMAHLQTLIGYHIALSNLIVDFQLNW